MTCRASPWSARPSPSSTSAGRRPRRRSSIFARTYADGRPFLDIERDEAAGYRVWADGYGTHLIAPDGTSCSSALPDEPAWRGLRLLSAQAMPLMTALRGREVMHAAGVVVGESLVGLVAASGTGKSATAANLMAQGGRFFADDVLPLDLVEGRVIAHPGGRIVNVHQRDLEAIAESRRGNIGVPMGQTDKLHLEPEGFPGALPLAALVFLERRPDTPETTLDPLEDVPRRLLGNAFLPYLVLPARLARQLEVAAALEQTVRLVGCKSRPATTRPRWPRGSRSGWRSSNDRARAREPARRTAPAQAHAGRPPPAGGGRDRHHLRAGPLADAARGRHRGGRSHSGATPWTSIRPTTPTGSAAGSASRSGARWIRCRGTRAA